MFGVFHEVGLANSLMALVPAIVILVVVYKQDKIEEEPKWLLSLLVFLGMLSAFLTLKIGSPIAGALSGLSDNHIVAFLIITNFFIIALLEEGLKYLSVRIPTWNNDEFNCRFDGVVYGACVGVGFALYESFFYGGQAEFSIMAIRALTSFSGHFFYGIIMGLLYGFARARKNSGGDKSSKLLRFLAFFLPWFLHGTYDFFGSLNLTWICFIICGIELIIAFIILKVSSVKDVRI